MAKQQRNIKQILIITVTVLLAVGAYYYLSGAGPFSKKSVYYGFYPNVAGLNIGTPVQVKGVTVGSVAEMELNKGDGIKVVFEINKDVKIPRGSIAMLEPGGINGGQGIVINMGKGPETLPGGSVLETKRDTGFIDNLNYKSGVYLRSGRAILLTFDTTVKKFNYILRNSLLNDIMNGVFYLDKKTGKFMALSGELKGYSITIDSNLIKIDTMTAGLAAKNENINKSIRSADTMMTRFAQKHFKEDLDTLRDNIKGIGVSIHKLKDNKLINDKSAYTSANASADSAKKGINDIKEHPKAHWMSVFGKNKKK